MKFTRELNNLKAVFIFIFLAILASCNTTLKASDINSNDLDYFILNENQGPFGLIPDENIENINIEDITIIRDTEGNEIDPEKIEDDFFTFPMQTRIITSYFGNRRNPITGGIHQHDGVDFSARIGETVMAAMDGVVTIAVYHRQYGNYITITHSNGYKTLYAHLNSFSVIQGEIVKKGQKIGESGNTGNSTGPHLHFSIYDPDNKAVNPLGLLRELE